MNRRILIALALLTAAALAGSAEAAQSPFGIATPDPGGAAFGGPFASIFHWIALRQSEFYRGLTDALSASKADGTSTWLLLGLSFLYGIFHAAGPGHGKAVISAYLVSSGETARRGVVISFAAALVQAVSAILVVTIFSVIFRVTAVTMTAATDWLEIASYALIMILGAWLVWTKAFGGGHHHHHHHHFVPAPAGHAHAHAPIHAEAIHDEHDHRGHDHRGHDHRGHDHHGHAHHHHGGAAVATAGAARSNPLVNAWSTILAVGIRPCSGAIIVLVFALSQGLFAVGIAATLVMAIGTGITVAVLAALAVSAKGLAVKLAGAESGFAGTIVRGIEIAGGVIVFLLGFLLLGGALSVT